MGSGDAVINSLGTPVLSKAGVFAGSVSHAHLPLQGAVMLSPLSGQLCLLLCPHILSLSPLQCMNDGHTSVSSRKKYLSGLIQLHRHQAVGTRHLPFH